MSLLVLQLVYCFIYLCHIPLTKCPPTNFIMVVSVLLSTCTVIHFTNAPLTVLSSYTVK